MSKALKETGGQGHLESELWSCGEVCLDGKKQGSRKWQRRGQSWETDKRRHGDYWPLEALKGFSQVETQRSQGSGDSILG